MWASMSVVSTCIHTYIHTHILTYIHAHYCSMYVCMCVCLHRSEEVKYQVEVREEMAGLEGTLAVVKRDYELLRMEYERVLASNEQAGPIATELRVTVDSLQKSISQHKSELGRYKLRTHKAEQQLAKV